MAINELLSSLTAGGLQQAGGLGPVVRVSIPAEFANNFDAMQKVTRSVLGKLGCDGCHSGFDIRYDAVREFIVDENGGVHTRASR
jgi:hypothetical protein